MRRIMLAVLVGLACSDESGPDVPQLQGTWIGTYTNSAAPGTVYEGVLQLTQDDETVTGTLTTNAGRAASVSGSVSGDRLTATFTYTDGCAGTASTTADLADDQVPPVLTGNYTSSDCLGETSGGYSLEKQ